FARPGGDDDDGATGAGRVLLLVDVEGAERGGGSSAVVVVVPRGLVQDGGALGGQALDLGGDGAGCLALLAQAGGGVLEGAALGGRDERVDGLLVVVELGEDCGFFEGEAGGEVVAGGLALARGEALLDALLAAVGALGDLGGGAAEQGQLLVAVGALGVGEAGALVVLDHLRDDPSGLVRGVGEVDGDRLALGFD